MYDLTFIIILVLTFGVINFFDIVFKSCLFFPYLKFLDDTGLSISPFCITWETKHFNRKFKHLSRYKPAFLTKWFQFGAYMAMFLMIPAFYLVTNAFWQGLVGQSFWNTDTQVDNYTRIRVKNISEKVASEVNAKEFVTGIKENNSNVPELLPIIPGLTLPISEVYLFIFTMLLCMVFHEIGHAVAACRENITITSFSIALYGFFPVAYVKLPAEDLKHLLPRQLLRIYCAGIFHNIVLSLFALSIVWMNPVMLSPVFKLGEGVSVLSIEKNSGLNQPGGLAANDMIVNVSGCKVSDISSWEYCLKNLHAEKNQGFCVSNNFTKLKNIAINDKNISACCPDSDDHLCFYDGNTKGQFCLPGRIVAEKSICYNKEDCGHGLCLIPIFPHNSIRLLRIERKGKNSVIFVGDISEVQDSVSVSKWTSNFKSLTIWYMEAYEHALAFIANFSAGLAVMNLIPSYMLDGEHITEIIINSYFVSIVRKKQHRQIMNTILNFIGLFLILGALVFNVIKFMY